MSTEVGKPTTGIMSFSNLLKSNLSPCPQDGVYTYIFIKIFKFLIGSSRSDLRLRLAEIIALLACADV